MITSSTAAGSTLARERASVTAITPRSTALRGRRDPPNLPMAVRTAEAINTGFMRCGRSLVARYEDYNPPMDTESLKILLALEPKWTVSLNGLEFLTLVSSDISITNSTLQFGKYSRKISQLEWLRPNVVRVHGRAKFRSQTDKITLYPG